MGIVKGFLAHFTGHKSNKGEKKGRESALLLFLHFGVHRKQRRARLDQQCFFASASHNAALLVTQWPPRQAPHSATAPVASDRVSRANVSGHNEKARRVRVKIESFGRLKATAKVSNRCRRVPTTSPRSTLGSAPGGGHVGARGPLTS